MVGYIVNARWNVNDCEVETDKVTDVTSVMLNGNGGSWEWYSGNGELRIDLMMKMDFEMSVNQSFVELIIRSCYGKHYSLRVNNTAISFRFWSGHEEYVLIESLLDFIIDPDVYYLFGIEILRNNASVLVNVSING